MTCFCFGLYKGMTIFSVHPSVDDAIEAGKKKGYTVKRESLDGCVFDGEENLFGASGGVTPVTIVPSEINDGCWCVFGAEGDDDSQYLQQASDYFPEENWMLLME